MQTHDIVAIGGSLGAVMPLRLILSELPADFCGSVFVTTHLPRQGVSTLVEQLADACLLPVDSAHDGATVQPGRVYVARPNLHLVLKGGVVRLGSGPQENSWRPAIDPLFRSAALEYGPRAVGILLSGMLNDGASGLVAIKRCGGVAIVQHPEEASAPDMPRWALQNVDVDYALPAAQIAAELVRLAAQPVASGLRPEDIALEVDIALGLCRDPQATARIAEPIGLTCPDCHGVLSQVHGPGPLRFRCQIGHAFTAQVLEQEQEPGVAGALEVALRIIEERAELVRRMSMDAKQANRSNMAEMYEQREQEYRRHAEAIRKSIVTAVAGS